MKETMIVLGLGIGVAVAAFAGIRREKADVPKTSTDAQGFAVLELFTSEGCSSCPPADELLAKIQNEYKNSPVYILAFHVDYWNHEGWKDPFSHADYTKRQRQYSRWLGVGSLYTPQLVINGASEYVGSDERHILDAITSRLGHATAPAFSMQAKVEHDQISVACEVAHVDENSELVLALVQKSGYNNVKAGENSGRRLSHVQIVKQLRRVPINTIGTQSTTLTLPDDFQAQDWEVVGFIQDLSNGHIASAGKIDLAHSDASK